MGIEDRNTMAQRLDYRRKSLKDASTMNKPSWVFKRITRFFADRKFITIAFIHLAITLVIFSECYLSSFVLLAARRKEDFTLIGGSNSWCPQVEAVGWIAIQ